MSALNSRRTGLHQKRLAVALFVIGMTLGPSAFAAGDMEGTWLGLPKVVWAWANILVFWGFLWRFAGPPFREFLQKRKQGISEGLNRAAEQAAEAEQMRAELTAQLDQFRQELEGQKERARVEAERERERILEKAEAERTKLLEQTEREIANQSAKARNELQEVAAGLAAELAAEKLSTGLDGSDRDRLFTQDIERLREAAS